MSTGSEAGTGPGGAPWGGAAETHTAVVYFAGDSAVKLKKPVDLGFVDFTTREARLAACRREVELNRRFAPDVYLGVGDVTGPDGRILDHVVLMRRMPANARLATLVRNGEDVTDVLRLVARALASWHARAPRGPEVDREGTRDALRGRWTDTFTQVRALPPEAEAGAVTRIDDVERAVRGYLDGRAALFAERIADGRVVDGHGDLLADDVFRLDDGPRVLDCLEFDDRLRRLDGLDDAACLAMDLERLGAPEAAARFLAAYAGFSGDPAPTSLWHHYVAYRAFMRAKVAMVRHVQGDGPARELAGRLAELALRHLAAGEVRLVAVGGPPGTGKSTLAASLADRLGASLLSSDRIRKETAGLGPDDRATAEPHTGLYSPGRTRATYEEMLRRARLLLERGETVVLDATWTAPEHREAAEQLAADTHSTWTALWCTLPAEVAARRVAAREGGWSDATPGIARMIAGETREWPGAIRVDTAPPPGEVAERAARAVRARDSAVRFRREPG